AWRAAGADDRAVRCPGRAAAVGRAVAAPAAAGRRRRRDPEPVPGRYGNVGRRSPGGPAFVPRARVLPLAARQRELAGGDDLCTGYECPGVVGRRGSGPTASPLDVCHVSAGRGGFVAGLVAEAGHGPDQSTTGPPAHRVANGIAEGRRRGAGAPGGRGPCAGGSGPVRG